MKLMIVIFILSFNFQAIANNCDKIVCTGTSQVTVSPEFTSMTQRLGIIVNSDPQNVQPPIDPHDEIRTPQPEPPDYNITVTTTDDSSNTPKGTDQADAPTPVGDTTTQETAAQQPSNSSNPSSSGSSGSGSSGNSGFSAPNAPTTPEAPGQGAQIIGQNIYSDENDGDDPSENKIESKTQTPEPLNNTQASTTKPSTEKSDKKNRDIASLPPVSGSGSGGGDNSPIGNYQSGNNANKNTNNNSGQQSVAAQALRNMDKGGFFGANGSMGSKRRQRSAAYQGRYVKGQNISQKLDKFGNPINDLKTAMQRRLLRNLASTGQLGKKNEFLFFSMCKHYDNYERSNNIDYGRSKCPPPK